MRRKIKTDGAGWREAKEIIMDSRWRTPQGGEINLAPLLDVIFCLLFFFVLATSLRQEKEALLITLPQSNQETVALNERILEVLITRENRIFFEGTEMQTGPELTQALTRARRALAGKNARQVLVRTDGEANVQAFLTVSDACAQAGLEAAMMEILPPERTKNPQ